MGIRISGYDVVCDVCGWTLQYGLMLSEAQSMVANGRGCIVVDGRVYCCAECKEKGEVAR